MSDWFQSDLWDSAGDYDFGDLDLPTAEDFYGDSSVYYVPETNAMSWLETPKQTLFFVNDLPSSSSSDITTVVPAFSETMYGHGGYQGLGIGNPGSYGGVTQLPETEQPSLLDRLGEKLDTAGEYLQTPGGKLAGSLIGAGVGGLGALIQNQQNKKAQKKYERMLAARQAAASKYSDPLHLTFDRTRVETPTARKGETLFFSGNKLPSYYAGGGSVSPTPLGFLRYLIAGKKLPQEAQAEKIEAIRRALQDNEGTMREGAIRVMYPAASLEARERAAGLAYGGYVRGGDMGQADTIDAKLSPGEYVWDADVVSALGDGNNEAGAARLDAMREEVRRHKRSASPKKIPPKAKSPLAYLKGAK